ncbi:AAA family ATPase, partial [Mycolicibacterium holsaticum]
VNLLDGLITAAELHHEVFPDLVQFVHGIVQEGFGIVAGPPKLGKSWWTLNLALAVAAGGRAFGKIAVEQRDVLLLALEDSPRRLQSRIRAVYGQDMPPHRLHLLTAVHPKLLHATITTWLMGHPHGLVILDTLGRARQQRRRGDDPYLADYQEGVALKDVVDAFPGSALLGVHHTRKASSDDWVDDLSGTLGLAGSADYVLVLRRARGSSEATLQVTGRDAPEGEYAFTVTEGNWTLSGAGLAEAADEATNRRERKVLGDRALEVLALVNERAPGSHTTAADVTAELGIGSDQARVYLNRLATGGRITKTGRGAYTSVTTVTSVTNASVTPPTPVPTSANEQNVTVETDVTLFHSQTSEPPGAPTEHTPGMTDRVKQILNRTRTQTSGATA